MNLATAKQKLGLASLELSYIKDENDNTKRAIDPNTNEPTKWLRAWDDDNRRQIVIHEDTLNAIKANPNMTNLGLKDLEPKEGKKGTYYTIVIVAYKTTPDVVL